MARLAVLTSGGDAPGMNAAIRAVTRCGLAGGHEVFSIRHGYTGLIAGELAPMAARDVGGILNQAGTILGSTRCEQLRTEAGRAQAVQVLRERGVDALIVIGGNGSQSGASQLARAGAPVIGIASTIDNDLYGTDVSLGSTTAVDVALEAIDRLRATASSMQRAFLVEIMGRDCGYLALTAGIAGGAESIVIPERSPEPAAVADELRAAYARGKSHAIIVVAEGARHNAEALLKYFHEQRATLGFDVRATRLGHVQRGGSPGAFDRMLGTRLGAEAVAAAVAGARGVLVGWCGGQPARTPLEQVAGRTRPADANMLELAHALAL